VELIKRSKSYSREYRPVILYLDDVNAIITAVNAKEMEIYNENYRFSSLEELKEHFGPAEINIITLAFLKPSVSVEFLKYTARVFVGSDPNSGQTFHEVDEILARCARKPAIIYSFWFGLFGAAPGFVPLFVKHNEGWANTATGCWVALFFGSVCWASYVRFRRYATVYLVRRHERKSFWQRNSDQIVMQVITLIIGAVLGIAGTQLKEHYFPSNPSTTIHQ
jgi:hypothetical protein